MNVTSLEIISKSKRMLIEPTEITEIRNRDVKARDVLTVGPVQSVSFDF